MLSTVLSIEGIFLPALAGFIATIFKAVLIWIISIFFPTVINTYGISASVFSSELLMNTILTPVIFKLLSFFKFLNIEQKGSQLDEV
jgi:rod shape-determining protein MreD